MITITYLAVLKNILYWYYYNYLSVILMIFSNVVKLYLPSTYYYGYSTLNLQDNLKYKNKYGIKLNWLSINKFTVINKKKSCRYVDQRVTDKYINLVIVYGIVWYFDTSIYWPICN